MLKFLTVIALVDIDFKILEFISDNDGASKRDILSKFPNKEFKTGYRLAVLEDDGYIYCPRVLYKGKWRVPGKIFQLSDKGITALQNYHYQKGESAKKERNERLWKIVPTAISIISLIKSFYPEIKELLKWLLQAP